MKMIKIFILLISLLSVNLLSNDIATISAIKGTATLERGTKTIKPILGTTLKQKDIIKTNENSKVQIIFKDETIITIGKNSRFSVEEYLFEDSKTSVAKFKLIKGAIKTLTGKIGKIAPQKFTVKAETSTIGIRGTNFVVIVADDGSHQAYCTYGAISVTYNGEVYIVKKGYFITISADGKVELKKFTPKDLNIMQESSFNIKSNNEDTKLLDVKLDDGDLDISFGDDSEMMIQDISDTLSETDRDVAQEKPKDHHHTEHNHPEPNGYTP